MKNRRFFTSLRFFNKSFIMINLKGEDGVSEGVRTLDHWSHNPALYQLSYTHHRFAGII
jgi:hypothetical protein